MNPLHAPVLTGALSAAITQDLSAAVYLGVPYWVSLRSVARVAEKSFKERKSFAESMIEIVIRTTIFFTLSLGVWFYRNSFSPEKELGILFLVVIHLALVFFAAKERLEKALSFRQTIEPFRNRLERIEQKIQTKKNALPIDKEHQLQFLRSIKENMFNLLPYSQSQIIKHLKKHEAEYKRLEDWAIDAG